MGVAVRKSDVLIQIIGNAICILFFSASLFAQTPPKEPFPFDWMRPDAPPTTRTLAPKVGPIPPFSPAQTPVEEAAAPAAPAPTAPAATELAPEISSASPAMEAQPQGNIVPAPANSGPAGMRQKPKPLLNEIDITNARILTLVEFRFVSVRDENKSLVLKPALSTGKSLRVEVPMALGCAFTVVLEFTDGAPERHEGINLCSDKKINLVE
jgi:hypothetical protein